MLSQAKMKCLLAMFLLRSLASCSVRFILLLVFPYWVALTGLELGYVEKVGFDLIETHLALCLRNAGSHFAHLLEILVVAPRILLGAAPPHGLSGLRLLAQMRWKFQIVRLGKNAQKLREVALADSQSCTVYSYNFSFRDSSHLF